MSLQNDDSNPPPIMSSEVAYSCAYVHTHFEHIPRRKLGKEWQHDQAASAGPKLARGYGNAVVTQAFPAEHGMKSLAKNA